MDNTNAAEKILLHPVSQVTVTTVICSAVGALGSVCFLKGRPAKPLMGAISGACGGFLISSVSLGLEKYRGKRDYWNPAIGAGAALAFDTLVVDPPKNWVRPLYRHPIAASVGVVGAGLSSGFLLLDKRR